MTESEGDRQIFERTIDVRTVMKNGAKIKKE